MIRKFMNKKNLYYFTTLFIALAVGIIGGIVDILQTQAVIDVSKDLGYPLYFFTLLGLFKITGGALLLLPRKFKRIRELAYFGFTLDFIFASYSSFMATGNILKTLIPIILLIILALSFYLKDKFE